MVEAFSSLIDILNRQWYFSQRYVNFSTSSSSVSLMEKQWVMMTWWLFSSGCIHGIQYTYCRLHTYYYGRLNTYYPG